MPLLGSAQVFTQPAFAAIAKKKFFEIDIRTGKAADRRAAQVESITAATFERLGVKGSQPASNTRLIASVF